MCYGVVEDMYAGFFAEKLKIIIWKNFERAAETTSETIYTFGLSWYVKEKSTQEFRQFSKTIIISWKDIIKTMQGIYRVQSSKYFEF